MKLLRPFRAVHAAFSLCALAFAGLVAPGVLIPSQAQAETTLASGGQAITQAMLPYTIVAAGTYYLADDLNMATNQNAIHVTAPNVTIDFNGHTLSQSYGQNINTCGVAIDAQNVSVLNGSIVGYYYGAIIGVGSNNCRIENMSFQGSTFVGVCCEGNSGLVRRCRIFDTGNSPINNASAYGVVLDATGSTGNRIVDCDISLSTVGVTYMARAGICSYNCTDTLAVGNRINGYDWGVLYSNATGKYRDNLTTSVTVPYQGGTDAGNNN